MVAVTWSGGAPTSADTFRRNLNVVARLNAFAGQRGIPLPLAVAWAISNPAVNVAIVGARRASQLHALTPAADVNLSADDADAIDAIDAILSGAAPVTGPPLKGCDRPCRRSLCWPRPHGDAHGHPAGERRP